METILLRVLEYIGLPVVFLIIGWLAGKYLKPFVHSNAERLACAKEIAKIADDITAYLLVTFPNAKWDDWLAQAVDRLIDATDLRDPEKAKQAIAGALARNATTEATAMLSRALAEAK